MYMNDHVYIHIYMYILPVSSARGQPIMVVHVLQHGFFVVLRIKCIRASKAKTGAMQ